jgi:hypothetical protein
VDVSYYVCCRSTQLVSVSQEVINADNAIREGSRLRGFCADGDWGNMQRLALLHLCQLARELIERIVKSDKSPRVLFGCAAPVGGLRFVQCFFNDIAREPIWRLRFVWLRLGRRDHLRLLRLAVGLLRRPDANRECVASGDAHRYSLKNDPLAFAGAHVIAKERLERASVRAAEDQTFLAAREVRDGCLLGHPTRLTIR